MNSAPADNDLCVWGCSPEQLHAQFWAAHGIQVVQRATTDVLSTDAQAFLLTETSDYMLFSPAQCLDLDSPPNVLFVHVRLHEVDDTAYRERVVIADEDRFVGFERLYHGSPNATRGRLILTSDRYIASLWQLAADTHVVRKRLASIVSRRHRKAVRVMGRFYDRTTAGRDMLIHLSQLWQNPPTTLQSLKQHAPGVWRHADAVVDPAARFIAPVWIGRGVNVAAEEVVVGPTILWDQRAAAEQSHAIFYPAGAFKQMTRVSSSNSNYAAAGRFYQYVKRAFDLLFSIIAIILTLPLYPFIMLAIYIEDGRPFFFGHRRETLGGRVFTCFKFRSMQKNAEQTKHELATLNKADGPQFFMTEDPRLTRVGALLRKVQLDELPQFFNVIVGQMSVVGPRPSPYSENQFCPAWREARLSVRAGVTGLWQVMRTRENASDFQEWIRFDIEYVDRISFKMDLWIIWRTVVAVGRSFLRLLSRLRPSSAEISVAADPEVEVNPQR